MYFNMEMLKNYFDIVDKLEIITCNNKVININQNHSKRINGLLNKEGMIRRTLLKIIRC